MVFGGFLIDCNLVIVKWEMVTCTEVVRWCGYHSSFHFYSINVTGQSHCVEIGVQFWWPLNRSVRLFWFFFSDQRQIVSRVHCLRNLTSIVLRYWTIKRSLESGFYSTLPRSSESSFFIAIYSWAGKGKTMIPLPVKPATLNHFRNAGFIIFVTGFTDVW